MRGIREAERITPRARSEAAIQSEASATQSEKTGETDEAKERKKVRGSREAECFTPKACFKTTIQSESTVGIDR
jgi:hypothetical protein